METVKLKRECCELRWDQSLREKTSKTPDENGRG